MSGEPAARPCRRLRSKGMFLDVEHDPSVPSMHDGFYWCTHSQNCLGPDAKAATPATCTPTRPCYEAPS